MRLCQSYRPADEVTRNGQRRNGNRIDPVVETNRKFPHVMTMNGSVSHDMLLIRFPPRNDEEETHRFKVEEIDKRARSIRRC